MQILAILYGGKSPEHEISIRSARNILAAVDRSQYQVILIGLDRKGQWHLQSETTLHAHPDVRPEGDQNLLAVIPGRENGQIIRISNGQPIDDIDVIFPIIHGPNGEDGTLQGLLRCLNLPFVGPDILGSSVAMDKDVCKRLLREANLLVAEGLCFHSHEKEAIDYLSVTNRLGRPVYIKPANMGSSVGVHKATNAQEFKDAINDAFQYDTKVIIEELLIGREIECAVLGNDLPEVTHVGEVITPETYDYEAKYVSETAAEIRIPTEVTENQLVKLQMVAKQAYQIIGCQGMARVDMFLTEDDDVYVNELNTLPGFTNISMYPKLWAHAGLSYPDLINRLLELAIARKTLRNALKTQW